MRHFHRIAASAEHEFPIRSDRQPDRVWSNASDNRASDEAGNVGLGEPGGNRHQRGMPGCSIMAYWNVVDGPPPSC